MAAPPTHRALSNTNVTVWAIYVGRVWLCILVLELCQLHNSTEHSNLVNA